MATTAKKRPGAAGKSPSGVQQRASAEPRRRAASSIAGKDLAHASADAQKAPRRNRATLSEEIKDETLHLRLRSGLKEDAASVLAEIGISVPEAIRVFLGRVVSERKFPFKLEVPNATTKRAMAEARRLDGRYKTAEALFDDLEKGCAR